MATTKTTKVLPVRQPLKREPTHPGEILREDVLPALRMNVSQAARACEAACHACARTSPLGSHSTATQT